MKYSALESDAVLAMQYDALALSAISRIYDRYLPWTNASLRPAAIQVALNDVQLNQRKVALELGSGLSTVFLAEMLADRGGRLISIDDCAGWMAQVEHWLSPAAKAVTTFVHAPIAKREYDGEPVDWYAAEVVARALRQIPHVDLLLVDGPPAYYHEGCLNRGPALELVRAQLAPSATIILDDINRSGEQAIAHRWSEELGVEYRDLTIEAGIALWTVGRANNISQ